ncbi:Defence response isoform 2 [Theobroma cacao]|uniref:Defence response isoform 2 n=1 Tax=Theobroma cacao TaxID=3641 RepID=A0A061DJX2_THECC|nr:Defence response isoform 2 [Theobroma cacao]
MKKSSLIRLQPVLALPLAMIITIIPRTITLQLQGGVSSATSTVASRPEVHGLNVINDFKASCDDHVSREHSLFPFVCFCVPIIFILLLLFINPFVFSHRKRCNA